MIHLAGFSIHFRSGAMASGMAFAATLVSPHSAAAIRIVPAFDDTILNAPDSRDIQNCINAAIAVYQPLFTDSIPNSDFAAALTNDSTTTIIPRTDGSGTVESRRNPPWSSPFSRWTWHAAF